MIENIKIALPFIMLFYFTGIYYTKYRFQSGKPMFLLYLFWGMFPYWIENYSFNLFDIINKFVLIIGLLIFLFHCYKYKLGISFNKYELLFVFAVLVSSINVVYWSYYLTGLTNIIYIYSVSFYIRNHSILKGNTSFLFEILQENTLILSFFSILEYLITKERVELTFSNPNYLGIYMVCGYIVLFYKKKVKMKPLILLFIFLGILTTGSDTIMITILLPIIFYITEKIKGVKLTKFVIVFLLFLGILGIIMATSNQYIIQDILLLLSKDSLRLTIWKTAINAFIHNPIIGVGYNNFKPLFLDFLPLYIPSTLSFEGGWVTHNDYLKILSELGIVGLGVFFLYLFATIKTISKIKDISKRSMFYSLLITLLLFSYTHQNINSLLFWVMFSVPFAYIKIQKDD